MQQVGRERLRDALALRNTAVGTGSAAADPLRWGGARYLAGIAVECQAKWILCERAGVEHVDDLAPELVGAAGHDIGRCLQLAGVLDRLRRSPVGSSWDNVSHWSVNWRYEPPQTSDDYRRDAERFVADCEAVFLWLAREAYP
jgi:hypothetical protein